MQISGGRRHNSSRPRNHLTSEYTRGSHAYAPEGNYGWQATDAFEQPPIDSVTLQDLLFQENSALVRKRIRDFKEMNDWASHLETWAGSSPYLLYQVANISIHRTSNKLTPTRTTARQPSMLSPP